MTRPSSLASHCEPSPRSSEPQSLHYVRHKRKDLPSALITAKQTEEANRAQTLLDRLRDLNPFARLAGLPGRPHIPDVWLLGSSAQSAVWAADNGLPYCFADFINPDGESYARIYRDRFCASDDLTEARMMVAGFVVCSETDEDAQRIASSARMTRALLNQGQLIPVPPIGKALQFLAERGPNPDSIVSPRRAIVGSPTTVRKGIENLAVLYGAEEVMVVTITFDHGDRRRSYELIAEAFGLG